MKGRIVICFFNIFQVWKNITFVTNFQIDQNVLKELPPEIQAQIETELQILRREPRQARQKVSSYSEEPGCSHWTSGEPPVTEDTSSAIVPLPDLSQVCHLWC